MVSFGWIMASNTSGGIYRMGVLVDPPVDERKNQPFNWNLSVVGSFFGPNPPALSVVQQVVDVHWQTRALIEVNRISDYFIFFCSDERDVLALLKLHTTFIDGRILTFRRGHRDFVPRDINFDMATMWVRVSGLPFAYLTPEWAVQTLKHVDHVLDLDFNGDRVPLETDFRACLLIPGCFLPLDGGQVVWIYFRYEGVFKFCKKLRVCWPLYELLSSLGFCSSSSG